MDDFERRRRARRRREMRRRKRRQALILRGILFAAALLILIGIIVIARNIRRRDASDNATESQVNSVVSEEVIDTTAETAEDVPEESENSMQTLSLSELQMHSGDLILVNPTYSYDFNANAETVNLVNILERQTVSYAVDKEEFQLSAHVIPHLDAMIQACTEAIGYGDTSISSAYRSLEYQQNVWNETEANYGTDYANQYVSAPGYSEHHTGLAVDLGITNSDGLAGSFSESNNAVWMDQHSWEYGFVRRFREDKVEVTGISNESWHFRYVGYPHAKYMYEQNLALEEYIDYLRNETSQENPLVITGNEQTWSIFFTTASEIQVPEGEYEVSGNNVDGFIITAVA